MPWLRVDDRFGEHSKLLGLTRADRWTWVEILCYCARHQSGNVPIGINEILRHATPNYLTKVHQLGLLDETEPGVYAVHDWSIYNGQTLEERVHAYLESNPDASANEVHRAIGGKREVVLALVPGNRNGTTPTGTHPGTKEPPEAVPNRYPSRARANPTPSPNPTPQERDVPVGSNATGRRRSPINPPDLKTVDQALEGRKR